MENQEVSNANPINQQSLPNATAVLVLGICSICLFCCFYGIVGLALSIIAMVLAKKANKLYNTSPDLYTESSLKNMKAGKTCSIIGMILSSLMFCVLIIYFIYFLFVGAALFSLPWEEVMNQNY